MSAMDRQSAKIYTFPARGRFALSGYASDSKIAANDASPRAAKISFGSSWYHDEAIQEAEPRRPRKI